VALVGPAVGTTIKGQGAVVRHDVTHYGLHRLCIALAGRYPDLELWCEMIKGRELKLHDYAERIVVNVCQCYLWLYWKEG
jgi:hypothetical protein